MVLSDDITPTARELGTDEPVLVDNARKVLEARYLKKNEAGNCLETPGQLFRRVARVVADVEVRYGATPVERQRWEDRYYELMVSGHFMPNSPTLMNAGREMGMLSACFVLPVKDSIVDIFDAIKQTALIQKAGGGTGFAFDELRPTGDFIASSGGTTSGPITFWRAFSEATNAIQQGAFRRGANMGMMYIHHPDILKFLHAKEELDRFTNYNISVKVTDTWMEELRADPDSPHVVRNPRTGRAYVIPRGVDIWKHDLRDLIEIDCVAPVSGEEKYYRTPRLVGPLPPSLAGTVYTKRDLWDIIVNNAWRTGEPGVVFIDRINQYNPTPHVGRIEATNPCGEQPLLPYEACNLGSLNLSAFVRNPCTPQAEVDWAALRETVHLATRYLDNIIDANNYPLPEIAATCQANRKIGLGIMGFADALFKLNVAYNSDEGVAWGERFMQFVNDQGHACSQELARQRGCFPNWAGSIWQTRYNRPMRNATVTTVAPTGTISIIANCSGGVEPLFSLAFLRNVLRGQKQGAQPLVEVNETFREVARRRGFLSDALLERLARTGTLAGVSEVPADVQRVFVCAHDIAPEWHMRMQAAFQRHCDASISKTINFPHDAAPEDVARIYHLAYELGCKGVTVYRDRCRELQPMALKNGGGESNQASTEGGPAARKQATRPPGEEPDGPSNHPSGNGGGLRAEAADDGRTEPAGTALAGGSGSPATTHVAVDRAALPPPPPFIEPMDLPEIVSGLRIRQMTPFGNMHVKITVDPRSDRELEVFAQLGKGGDVATSDLEAICRIVSLWLRAGGSLRHVIKQLAGIGSSLQIPTRAGRIMSLGDGLACALKKYVRAKEYFGLRPLLLGEVDLSELDAPRPPHARARLESDRTVEAALSAPVAALSTPAALHPTDGNGNSRAAARGLVGGERLPQLERRGGHVAAPLSGAFESESPAATARVIRAADGNGHDDEGQAGFAPAATATAVAEIGPVRMVDDVLALHAVAHSIDAHGVAMFDAPVVTVAAAHGFGTPLRHEHDAASHYILRCPQCGGVAACQEGCIKCANHCGWAAC